MKALAVLIFLSACSVTQKSVIGPDGTKHKLISCSVADDCYKKAKSICGTYKIVNTTNEGAGDARVVKLLVKCDEKN